MDRPARILPWALSLCCLTAQAAGDRGEADQPGLRAPFVGVVRTSGSALSWRVAADHYFSPSLGLRATGGLQGPLGNDTVVRLGATQRRAMPYVGLGYSTGGVSANRWGGWGLSADIGVQASGSSDLQLGVSYAF
ncbi:MAG: hypothetical protein RL260_214 [Pseudomonadota bacterium]|jgi:hypothetical protein